VTNPIIDVKSLTKRYSASYCLGPLDITLSPGETIALLGQNGAGKTTLFQLLTGNLDATDGTVHVGAARLTPDKYDLKKSLGYLPQNLLLPKWVTGKEILRYAASLYQLPDPEKAVIRAMEYWDCFDYKNMPLATCSHGMQKRVALAIATLHDPACLILDEPFSGLDLFHIKALDSEIRRRQKGGQTTILSTHIAPYAASLCQRAFILEKGQLRTLDHWESADSQARVAQIEHEFFD
jgi:ABC-type multidrug transport system ATPase subunit